MEEKSEHIEEKITATIGEIPELSGKVVPLEMPENFKMPYCVYISNGAQEDDTLNGWIGSYECRMELNILHSSYRKMKLLSGKVIGKLKTIDYATVLFEDFRPEIYEKEIKAYRKVIEIRLQF